MISSRAEVCVYRQGKPPSRVGREIIPGSFAVSGGAIAFIHSQTADYIVHFIAVAATATTLASLSSPILSLVSTHMHALSLSLTHSHLTHTHITFLKWATPLLQQWQLQMQETH